MKIKSIALVMVTLMFAGCTNLGNWIPEKYDAVEFNRLAELHVISSGKVRDDMVWCLPSELKYIRYNSEVLAVYAEHTLKERIAEIYTEIADLATELATRKDPSEAYCRIKRNNISELTYRALEVYGQRSKK